MLETILETVLGKGPAKSVDELRAQEDWVKSQLLATHLAQIADEVLDLFLDVLHRAEKVKPNTPVQHAVLLWSLKAFHTGRAAFMISSHGYPLDAYAVIRVLADNAHLLIVPREA